MLRADRFWIIGTVDLVLWIDKLFLKSLPRAMPDLDRLLAEPANCLSESPVTIGPVKRNATAIFLGLLLAIPNWILIFVLFTSLLDPRKGPPFKREDGALLLTLFLAAVGAAFIASILFMIWLLRGGHMVLKPEGVELRRGRYVIRCPWSLFNVPGQPHHSSHSRAMVPINTGAASLTELYRSGRLIARGSAVRSRQFRFEKYGQVMLGGLYVVKIRVLAELLLHLGRTLNTSLPQRDLKPGD
jgi:hypothetical protein